MKKLGVILTLYGMLALMAYWPYRSNQDIELEIRNHVVEINTITPKGNIYGCTGTLLSHNYVLTTAHCFPKLKPQVYIRRVNDKDFMTAVIVSSATKTDYALLQFKGLDKSNQVEFSKEWNLGDEIILYGNPGIQNFVLGHSRIVGYVFVRSPMHKIRTMLAYPCNESAPGFSGSGIYNMKGQYIGTHELGEEIPILYQIATRLAGEPRQGPLCFAIPAKEAMERNLDRPWYGYNMEDK